jgi:hypothetical protein
MHLSRFRVCQWPNVVRGPEKFLKADRGRLPPPLGAGSSEKFNACKNPGCGQGGADRMGCHKSPITCLHYAQFPYCMHAVECSWKMSSLLAHWRSYSYQWAWKMAVHSRVL